MAKTEDAPLSSQVVTETKYNGHILLDAHDVQLACKDIFVKDRVVIVTSNTSNIPKGFIGVFVKKSGTLATVDFKLTGGRTVAATADLSNISTDVFGHWHLQLKGFFDAFGSSYQRITYMYMYMYPSTHEYLIGIYVHVHVNVHAHVCVHVSCRQPSQGWQGHSFDPPTNTNPDGHQK